MLKNYLMKIVAFFLIFSNTSLVFAQESSGMMGNMHGSSCLMCGAMGWGGMVLGAVLLLSASAALIALAIYLIRRSRGGLTK